MKKYNSIFVCAVIAAVVLLFASVLVFSLISSVPAFIDEEMSDTVFSGGMSGPFMTVLMIVLPLLFVFSLLFALQSYKKALNTSRLCSQLEDKRKCASAVHLFILCSSLITIASLIYACVHRENNWDHQFFAFGADAQMDFFNHITYARYPSETYAQTIHACFPPLA